MNKLEEVKKVFSEAGATLLKGEYVNQASLFEFECCCGTIDTKSFKNFRVTPKCTSKDHYVLLNLKKEKEAIYYKQSIIKIYQEISKFSKVILKIFRKLNSKLEIVNLKNEQIIISKND